MRALKLPYENELYELRKWIDFTNANLHMQFLHTPQEIQRVYQWINAITRGIQADYPFYATTLPCVANILFQQNEVGAIFLNPAAFGELVVIVRHIKAEPVVVQFWSEIHPRIVNVSRELFVDGHCSAAAEKAIKEVESRLREKFSELKPGAAVPSKIGDVIGALMSENGAFKFCDTTTTSGRGYRRGIQSLFEGIMKCVLGIFIITHAGITTVLFSYVFSIYIIINGIICIETAIYMQSRNYKENLWILENFHLILKGYC